MKKGVSTSPTVLVISRMVRTKARSEKAKLVTSQLREDWSELKPDAADSVTYTSSTLGVSPAALISSQCSVVSASRYEKIPIRPSSRAI